MEALAGREASQAYQDYFYMVEAVFHHQTIFDLISGSTIPLEKTDPLVDVRHLCGKYP